MNSEEVVELKGVPGSPYTRKMLALLRYRRIPYRLLQQSRFQEELNEGRYRERPSPKVALLPTFYFYDDDGTEKAICDTTPVVRRLESSYRARQVVPANGTLAFVNFLIEDYADEWLTKAMFHYRWSYDDDIKKAGQMLPRWGNTTADEAALQQKAAVVSQHQISRLSYVGSNPTTRDTIEKSFERFLKLLDKHLQSLPFLLGKRPSSADFAVYGQLTCMALFDPTPQAIVLKHSPRVYAWTETMEDHSGYELLSEDWIDPENELPETLMAILCEVGRVYTPYLLANAEAVQKAENEFSCKIDGRRWQQSTFPYQAKCLNSIRELYCSLDQHSQAQVARFCDLSDNAGLIGKLA